MNMDGTPSRQLARLGGIHYLALPDLWLKHLILEFAGMHFPPLEFHLTKFTRDAHQFDRDLVLHQQPDMAAVQDFALRLNRQGQNVRPGDLFALVLLQQVFHRVIERYRLEKQPRLFDLAQAELAERLGAPEAERMSEDFGSVFPPLPVYQARVELRQFLRTYTHGRANRDTLLEQMLLVHVGNRNPALGNLKALIDDSAIPSRALYENAMAGLRKLMQEQPSFGAAGLTLFDLLESPFKASPHSLAGQLKYIAEHWDLLDDELRRLLLLAVDLIKEDETRRGAPAPGKAQAVQAWTPRRGEELPEHYSADTEWMPRAVLIAKSVNVWLDQLSKEYGREIRTLDQIPNQELEKLSRWGFTALWLIGLWERSRASQKIKHLRGNIDAAASAYSLYDYTISHDLGGDAALDSLRERALNYGIRLACDVVPNHMGIDSRWVIEHPHWFLQLDHPPYPAYRFTGPDLCNDERVSVRIEDGYWHQTDAAVVFERRDDMTGDARYIYHGNDGTQMPWNDTAQLNFLLPEVREAVIRQILSVARRFSLIRFDAAMTLAKLHYQRLWFPEPGSGGTIPSRAWFGMTKEEFDRAMPTEFWREVVDRVNAEAPDTLLLAEAFWLTEGLFVRTLGMHRVYNSAFMNMLKDEKNAEFRRLLKNVLAYDARILERYVNFMNNPDEETAVEQFGKGDKYFGVAVMMCTLPGLPMFGHGQIEGFTEKYGHEYRRAYYQETPDADLVERHERELFPILRRRRLFSQTQTFALHDFVAPEGHVEENVFAYTNRTGNTHTLVIYHNRYAETRGWVRDAHDGRTLTHALHLHPRPGIFCVWKDLVTGLEYLQESGRLAQSGFYLELRAYEYHVFSEFHEVEDIEGRYRKVADRLQGRGTASVEREVQRILLQPLTAAFAEFVTPEHLRQLRFGKFGPDDWKRLKASGASPYEGPARRFAELAVPFLEQARYFGNGDVPVADVLERITRYGTGFREYEAAASRHTGESSPDIDSSAERVLTAWAAVSQIGHICSLPDAPRRAAHWFDEWFLSETLVDTFVLLGADRRTAERDALLVRILTAYQDVVSTLTHPRRYDGLRAMFNDPLVRRFLHVNLHNDIEWFNAEAMDDLLLGFMSIAHALSYIDRDAHGKLQLDGLHLMVDAYQTVSELAALSEYQMERFLELLSYFAAKPSMAVAT